MPNIPGDHETTAPKAAIGAALGSIVMWLGVKYLSPDLEEISMPITMLVTYLFCRFVPAQIVSQVR